MKDSIDREIESFNAALGRLRVEECADYIVDSEWRDPSVRVDHINTRLRTFLERILGPVNRVISGMQRYPGGNFIHYGNLLCMRESICVLQERYGCGLLDLYENEDLCDAKLVPFFTGPDGWLYCIRKTYLDDAEKSILVIGDGARSERGIAEDARIIAAGTIPMSMADMMMRFANHAEINIESVRKAIEDDNEQVPPYSLIAWPIR